MSETTPQAQAIQEKLAALKAKMPEAWAPILDKYGPALVTMSEAQLWAWLERVSAGDYYNAQLDLLNRLPNRELLDSWATLEGQWDKANKDNTAALAAQRTALGAVLKVLVTAALPLVGL